MKGAGNCQQEKNKLKSGNFRKLIKKSTVQQSNLWPVEVGTIMQLFIC